MLGEVPVCKDRAKLCCPTGFLCRKIVLVLLNLPWDDGGKKGSKEGKQTPLKAVSGPAWEGALRGSSAWGPEDEKVEGARQPDLLHQLWRH